MSLATTIRRYASESRISKWRAMAARIERMSDAIEQLTDDQLRRRSLELVYESKSGTPLDRLLPEAFALVRDAARRTIGLSHYPVQLIGGIALFHRSIIVMQTGEGKTLTATLPMYLNALVGKGAHLATANDYLAQRDADLMRPVYQALGMSVGVVTSESDRVQRAAAYKCDITYTTAKEIGFDFLRDRLIKRHQTQQGASDLAAMIGATTDAQTSPVGRGLHAILIDEADNVLIDEARTPLVVSSTPDRVAVAKKALYQWAAEVVKAFVQGVDYTVDKETKAITLSAAGRRRLRSIRQPSELARTPVLDINEQIEMAIYVNENYVEDRHYVVRDEEVVIVDEFTGRLAEGRKWRSGIHQAIEARAGLEISVETAEAARITIQDLFLKYEILSGMTGTVASSAPELKSIYKTNVINIPTNKPPQRVQLPTHVFGTGTLKWEAIADEVEAMLAVGRPVLIGTRSIDKSDALSVVLNRRGITHEVLNARHLAREAEIVANAGQIRKVTVATNMAGRGTDIKLASPALEAGGLHVICSELHESARIDRQLVGRCGRQGSPGTFRQFLAMDDDILETGLGFDKAAALKTHSTQPSKSLARFAKLFYTAQARIEKRHFEGRKMLLYHDGERQKQQRDMGQDPYLDTAGN